MGRNINRLGNNMEIETFIFSNDVERIINGEDIHGKLPNPKDLDKLTSQMLSLLDYEKANFGATDFSDYYFVTNKYCGFTRFNCVEVKHDPKHPIPVALYGPWRK